MSITADQPDVLEFAYDGQQWRVVMDGDKCTTVEVDRGPDATGASAWTQAMNADLEKLPGPTVLTGLVARAGRAAGETRGWQQASERLGRLLDDTPSWRCKHCKLSLTDDERAKWVGCDACKGDGLVQVTPEPSTVPDAPGWWFHMETPHEVVSDGGTLWVWRRVAESELQRVQVAQLDECLWGGPVRRDPAPADAGPQLAAIGRTLGQCDDETVEQAAARVMAEIVSRVDREVDLMRELDKARAQPADAGLRARVEKAARRMVALSGGDHASIYAYCDSLLRTALDADGPRPVGAGNPARGRELVGACGIRMISAVPMQDHRDVRAALAERVRERDDARLMCVKAWAKMASPGGVGFDEMCRLIAIKKGWGYLYPETISGCESPG